MKVGDLIRVVPRQWRCDSACVGQLGVIITLGHSSHWPVAHIMLTNGSKVWLETKRLEVQSESRRLS